MYIFPEETRKAYEAQPIPAVYYQFIDEKIVPVLVTDGFCRQVGFSRPQAMALLSGGKFESMHPDDAGRVAHISMEFAHRRSNYDVVFRSRRKEEFRWIHAVGRWQRMPDGTELAVLTYEDIKESEDEIFHLTQKYQGTLTDMFYIDPVTSLPNVNYLNQFAKERVHALRVLQKTPVLIYFDINSMQSYNNQYGFAEGDNLLCLIAKVLAETFPDSLLVRGAEDHFVIITELTDHDEIGARIELANRRIKHEAFGNTTGFHAGVYVYEENSTTPEAIDHAKHALKRLGMDLNISYRIFSREADDAYWNQRYIVENFDRALEKGWFRIYYQGICSVETRRGVAMEALARWVDPVRGIISPGEFIPALERYHLLHKMDLFMFEQVCREIPLRLKGNLALTPISVNFSRQDFDYVDVVSELNQIVERYQIEQYGIGKNYFIIEITEQDMAMATDHFYEQLREIRNNGYRLWLDDFGSGYSSLNVFSKFDVDLIKFDMELVRNLDMHNGANREILKSMTNICKKLQIHTLAEGVETEEQYRFLQSIGCELVQGFAFYRPEPLEAILYRKQSGGVQSAPLEPIERVLQMI